MGDQNTGNLGNARTVQTLSQIFQASACKPTKENFMKRIGTILAVVLLTASSSAALAAEPAEEGWLDGPWRYSAVIYGWLPNAPMDLFLDGEKLGGIPESLSNIIKALEMMAMLEFEAHKGRLGLYVSPIYYKGKYNKNIEGKLGQTRKFTLKETVWLVDYGVGLDIGTWKGVTVTPFFGARYFHDDLSIEVTPGELDQGVDFATTIKFNTPVAGLKAAVNIGEDWSVAVEGDWGVWNDSLVNKTYQYMGVGSYHFTMKKLPARVLFGYRYLLLDIENDVTTVGLKVAVKGPFIGLGVSF